MGCYGLCDQSFGHVKKRETKFFNEKMKMKMKINIDTIIFLYAKRNRSKTNTNIFYTCIGAKDKIFDHCFPRNSDATTPVENTSVSRVFKQ